MRADADMLPKVLITGFKPFPGMAYNPTESLVHAIRRSPEQFPGVALKAVALDVDYQKCERQWYEAYQDFRPDVIFSFGVERGASQVRLEQHAVNLDCDAREDSGGRKRTRTPIAKKGPKMYTTALPMEAVQQHLRDQKIPAQLSHHGGTYVCNHLYYFGLHTMNKSGVPAKMGFVHMPLSCKPSESAADGGAREHAKLLQIAAGCIMAVTSIAGLNG